MYNKPLYREYKTSPELAYEVFHRRAHIDAVGSSAWVIVEDAAPERAQVALNAHPSKGWSLIRIALANPTIRNRSMAIRALTAWPPDTIPDHVIAALQHASVIEADPTVRGRMRQLLTADSTGRPPATPPRLRGPPPRQPQSGLRSAITSGLIT